MSEVPPTRKEKRQRQKEGAQARRAAQVAALRRQQRNRRLVRIGVLLVVAVGAVLLIGALGGDDDGEDVATDETLETTSTSALTTTTAAPIAAEPIECAPPTGENTDLSSEPTVPVPDEPATTLTCTDLVVGEGEAVENVNDTVQVHYVGVSQATGEEFDSSWDRGEPATFNLQGVIDGWTQGIPGMKVGGRRVLTIPAELAYGDEGEPSGTLVFVVDLLAVNPES